MKNRLTKVLIIILISFIGVSCNSLNKTDNFIGKWELAKSGNEELKLYSKLSEFELVIEKKDQFYIAKSKAKINNEEIDFYKLSNKDVKDSTEKNVVENMFRYTLTNENNMLINVYEPLINNILYNEKEDLICFNSPIFHKIWLSRKQ